jgi:hypothetical protein
MASSLDLAKTCEHNYNFCTLHVDENNRRWVPFKGDIAGGFFNSYGAWNTHCGRCNDLCLHDDSLSWAQRLGSASACTGMTATGAVGLAGALAGCTIAPDACIEMLDF